MHAVNEHAELVLLLIETAARQETMLDGGFVRAQRTALDIVRWARAQNVPPTALLAAFFLVGQSFVDALPGSQA